MAMKVNAYNNNNNAAGNNNSNNKGGKSIVGGLSQCRRRLLRSKVQLQAHFKKEGLGSGVFLRRGVRYMMVLSFLYLSLLIMCVGPFSGFVGRAFAPRAVYRSPKLFARLWPDILADNSTPIQLSSVWKYKRRLKMQRPRPCPTSPKQQRYTMVEDSAGPSGYLIVEANGGLNQQRSAICNAVAVAGLLNAVLVIPRFGFNNVWRDPSEFQDIYDEDHFISTLEGHVKVVKELPDDLLRRFNYDMSNITNFRVDAWASIRVYLGQIYPVLREQGVVRIAPFANRLAMNVPPHIQLLRCITNYKALRFSPQISAMSNRLVDRMVEKSSITGGKFVSVHLRFEEDMLAFSCCVYDGGDAEKFEMDLFRERGWSRKFKGRDLSIISGQNRISGKCPLTPLEVGMMLRGMGFDNNTSVYLASGKIYQAERYLAPLLEMFPLLYSKESLATPDELAPFEGYSSRLAALDYTVCLFSEVFVTTQGGNFPHFLMGHRRFLFDGHAKTIKPDKIKLVLLLQNMKTSWAEFKNQTRRMLAESDRKGIMVPRIRKFNRKNSVYTYPLPECECLLQHNSTLIHTRAVNVLDSPLSLHDEKRIA